MLSVDQTKARVGGATTSRLQTDQGWGRTVNGSRNLSIAVILLGCMRLMIRQKQKKACGSCVSSFYFRCSRIRIR